MHTRSALNPSLASRAPKLFCLLSQPVQGRRRFSAMRPSTKACYLTAVPRYLQGRRWQPYSFIC